MPPAVAQACAKGKQAEPLTAPAVSKETGRGRFHQPQRRAEPSHHALRVLHILQPLDRASFEAGLAGVLLWSLVRLGLTRFAAFLLLALGHEVFQSGEMPVTEVGAKGGGFNVGVQTSTMEALMLLLFLSPRRRAGGKGSAVFGQGSSRAITEKGGTNGLRFSPR